MISNVLITGGAGYIGSMLSEKIANTLYPVKLGILDNFLFNQGLPASLIDDEIEIYPQDIRDTINCIKDYDIIIHLAALVGAPACDKAGDNLTHQVNYEATKKLVESLSKDQVIIFPNTNSGYGKSDGADHCTEETPMNPISTYGKTKCEAEKVVLDHPNGIVLRLATVFGVSHRMRLDLMVNDFAYKAWNNKLLKLYEPKFRRNFIHIKDVVGAFWHAIHNREAMKQNVYNVGIDWFNMTKEELAAKICRKFDAKLELMDGKDPDQRDYLVSSEKIYATGFTPRFSLDYGLDELAKFYSLLPKDATRREYLVNKMRNA